MAWCRQAARLKFTWANVVPGIHRHIAFLVLEHLSLQFWTRLPLCGACSPHLCITALAYVLFENLYHSIPHIRRIGDIMVSCWSSQPYDPTIQTIWWLRSTRQIAVRFRAHFVSNSATSWLWLWWVSGQGHLLALVQMVCLVVDVRIYRWISDISRTKSQNLNVSRFVLQLSLPNLLKPGVKLRMKM